MNLGFSVDGKWLTNLIRERYFHENMSYDLAVEMIGDLLKGNDLSDQRIEQIAQDIILGRSYFNGNTRDGSFTYCDGSDEPISAEFFRKYSSVLADLKQEKEDRKKAIDAWQELALVINGEMKRDDCVCQCNIDLLKPTPAQEFIERMIAPDDEVAPYGFITPAGDFIPVKYAEHERFAGDYLRAHEGWEAVLEHGMHTGTDYLVYIKGWLLLHNPRQGKPFLTQGDIRMTKSQREALFDYYTKYGMKEAANALYQEDKHAE